MILPVSVVGATVLRKATQDVEKDYVGLNQLIADMFETMYKADGMGLAAPQVGLSIRLFVIDASHLKEDMPELADFKRVFINAKILEESGAEWSYNEGCLSVPGIHEDVKRKSTIRVQYYDENWNFHDEILQGMKARVVQHEHDHTDGKLFIDKISPIKRRLISGKINSISKGKFQRRYSVNLPVKH